jgi:hypothetical protein
MLPLRHRNHMRRDENRFAFTPLLWPHPSPPRQAPRRARPASPGRTPARLVRVAAVWSKRVCAGGAAKECLVSAKRAHGWAMINFASKPVDMPRALDRARVQQGGREGWVRPIRIRKKDTAHTGIVFLTLFSNFSRKSTYQGN